MFPLHTWLPDAHAQAPTQGSVILAAILLKLGTYGFVRIALPMLPQGAERTDFLASLGAQGEIAQASALVGAAGRLSALLGLVVTPAAAHSEERPPRSALPAALRRRSVWQAPLVSRQPRPLRAGC